MDVYDEKTIRKWAKLLGASDQLADRLTKELSKADFEPLYQDRLWLKKRIEELEQ